MRLTTLTGCFRPRSSIMAIWRAPRAVPPPRPPPHGTIRVIGRSGNAACAAVPARHAAAISAAHSFPIWRSIPRPPSIFIVRATTAATRAFALFVFRMRPAMMSRVGSGACPSISLTGNCTMKVFVTGATGYIGGSVGTRPLEKGHAVIGLAPWAEAAAARKKRGIEPLPGDINAYTPFIDVTQRVDAVINAANSDNAFVVHALLTGLRGSGKTLIQPSGSSFVGRYDNGEASDDTFDEDTPFTPQPEKAMRVAIDQAVLASAKENVRSIVIRPTLIYGRGLNVSSTRVQLPKLIDVARKHGVPRHVGRGLNIWGHVHIADVADLYVLAL